MKVTDLWIFVIGVGRVDCMVYDEKHMMDWHIVGPTRSNREAKCASFLFFA